MEPEMMLRMDPRAKLMDDLTVRIVERIIRNAVSLLFSLHGKDLERLGIYEFMVTRECLNAACGLDLGPPPHTEEERMKVDAIYLRKTFEDLFQHLSDRLRTYENIELDILKFTLPKPIVFSEANLVKKAK